MHSEVLTARSLFFRKALSGGFKEAEERVVELPEDDPEIFGMYLHYVQTNELSIVPEPLPEQYTGMEEQGTLARMYVLAEKLQDVKSKNAIVRGMIASCYQKRFDNKCYFFGPKSMTLLYQGTMPGSKARKLVVEMRAYDYTNTESLSQEGWPYEFLTELACEFIKYRDTHHDKKKKFWRRDHPEDYMEEEETGG